MKKIYLLLTLFLGLFSCSDDSDNIPILTPEANFTYTQSPYNNYTVNFLNASKSIHSQSKYLWYFGDGDSSFLENPVHVYAKEGYYNVVLRVTNKELKDSYASLIKISNHLPDTNLSVPVLSFVYSQSGKDFTFQNTTTSPDSGIVYSWNFGEDVAFIAGEANGNAKHTFSKDGTYSVVLKAIFNKKIYCTSKSVFVSEKNISQTDTIAPIPSFIYNFVGVDTINFINTSSYVNAGTKYHWIFSKGNESDEENPEYIKFTQGTYNVVLKVTNGNYTMTFSREIEVPKADKPVALFVFSQNGLVSKFVNASSNVSSTTKYQWFFGDGEFSNEENPQHIYDAAYSSKKLTVILKVSNNQKSDIYSAVVSIP